MRYLYLESDASVNLREELAEAEHLDDAFDDLYSRAEIKATSLITSSPEFKARMTNALNTWHLIGV